MKETKKERMNDTHSGFLILEGIIPVFYMKVGIDLGSGLNTKDQKFLLMEKSQYEKDTFDFK